VLDIQDDGSVVTYSGPAIYSDTGVRPLLPTAADQFHAPPRAVPAAVAEAIRASSERHGLSSSLLAAVAWQESRFHQTAVSPKGALGVMQLMPATARLLGADAHDLSANVDAGAAYLVQMIRRFDGDLPRALAAYNAGPEAVARFGGVPPYAETRAYVGSILANLARTSLGARPE
jgi:soluble lytic murein transglycosylase-like protein